MSGRGARQLTERGDPGVGLRDRTIATKCFKTSALKAIKAIKQRDHKRWTVTRGNVNVNRFNNTIEVHNPSCCRVCNRVRCTERRKRQEAAVELTAADESLLAKQFEVRQHFVVQRTGL